MGWQKLSKEYLEKQAIIERLLENQVSGITIIQRNPSSLDNQYSKIFFINKVIKNEKTIVGTNNSKFFWSYYLN